MDGSRFDGITRVLASGATRRLTLRGLTGGALAGLLGLTGIDEAVAGCVKPGKKGCKGPKSKKCCSGATCQGGSKDQEGKCRCQGRLKQCGSKCVNTKNDKKNCGKCNKKCVAGNTCKNGKCTSKLGCKAGQTFCTAGLAASCPGSDNESCLCITDVHGVPHCTDGMGAFCADCDSNEDCPVGSVCTPARAGICGCDDVPASNGNGCISATCDGFSGSGAGRSRPRIPFRR